MVIHNNLRKLQQQYTTDIEVLTNKNTNEYLINNWIKLDTYTKRYNNIPLPIPLLYHITEDINRTLEQFIGVEASSYLNTIELDRLKDLALEFDYLGIDDLLEIVCANIAIRYVYKKDIKELKII